MSTRISGHKSAHYPRASEEQLLSDRELIVVRETR